MLGNFLKTICWEIFWKLYAGNYLRVMQRIKKSGTSDRKHKPRTSLGFQTDSLFVWDLLTF